MGCATGSIEHKKVLCRFALRTLLKTLCDPQIADAKIHKFGVTCPDVFLLYLHRAHSSIKNSVSASHAPDEIHVSYQMQKHKSSVTCPVALFIVFALSLLKYEK